MPTTLPKACSPPRLRFTAWCLAALCPIGLQAQTVLDVEDLACHSAPAPILGHPVVERFVAASCADCWAAKDAGGPLVLDWIVPTGTDAPLQPAASEDAAQRLERLSLAAPDETRTRVYRHVATPAPVELRATSGTVPIGGYVALQLIGRASSMHVGADRFDAYLALAERIPAGTEGTPVERWLVRTVIGPLPLGPQRMREVRATRVPETAHPARLRALAWAEDRHGRIQRLVRTRCRGD